MSFNDLEAGFGGPRVSTSAPEDQEYRKVIQGLSQDIFLLNANRGQIGKLVDTLGTSKDTPELRQKLHDKREKTQALAKDIGHKLKELSKYQEDVDDTVKRKRRLEQEKLTRDFQKTLGEFQGVERLAAAKSRQALTQAKTAAQEQEERQLRLEEDQEEEQPLLDEQRHVQLRVLDNEINFNEALIRERESEIQEIEQGIIELNTVFRDLGTIVTEQQSLFDNIETNINNVKTHTSNASRELVRASEYQKRSRKLMCYIFIFVCIFLVIVFLIALS
ncbi:hypothetical protein EV182_000193 [Spiromyces aspiralis]|uniref:Uncharacterized protein n=1 Tax=Spiromyces aspiralis TaxID=68401 RepID=A0ACC1HH83_9FUNG|nr:hypothetical protein EV182_000193 [Spiromyces aspiralis]